MNRIGISDGPASNVPGGAQTATRKQSFLLRTALALAALTLPLGAQSTAPREVVLHTWVDTSTNENGGSFAGMTIDSAGNLYGATFGTEACSVGCGSVFKLVKQANGSFRYQTLYNFKGDLAGDGSNPYGAPILDSAGNIYGTTMGGGFGLQSGVVYKLTPTGNGRYTETVLHEFGAFGTNDGSEPFSTLAFDSAGNLYGTTDQGGGGVGGTFCLNGCGTVFKLSPNADGTWTESVIHSFPGTSGNTDGQNPTAASSSTARATCGARPRMAETWEPACCSVISQAAARFSS